MTHKWRTMGMVAATMAVAVGLVIALEQPEWIEIHEDASLLGDAVCIGCHGTKTLGTIDDMTGTEETTTNPGIPTFHALHRNEAAFPLQCTMCHQTVDLLEGSAAHLRKQVSVNTCLMCHSGLFAPTGDEGPVGDLSGDGRVNFIDYAQLTTQLGWTGQAGSIPEDIIRDGTVNIGDLAELMDHWLDEK